MSADMTTSITIEYPGTMKMEVDDVEELVKEHVDLSEAFVPWNSMAEPKPTVSGFGGQISYDDLQSSSDLNADWAGLSKALDEIYPGATLDVFARWAGEEPNESRTLWRAGTVDLWRSFKQVEVPMVVPDLVRQAKVALETRGNLGNIEPVLRHALADLVRALS